MRKMLATFPWHSTPLGPMEEWPQSLKTCVSYMMGCPHPRAIWWGPELVLLYNDGYREIAGSKHPGVFGVQGNIGKLSIKPTKRV